MSRCLSDLGIEHVVLERGKVAQRWRSQSWDSLHLLTPNWMTRLPGFDVRRRRRGRLTPVGGLYALGLNFQRRRNSSFIDGVGDDAWVIANEIARSMASARVA